MKMNFENRKKDDALLPYINLNENEQKLYHGAGHALVAVDENGEIIEINYLDNFTNKFDAEKSATQMAFMRAILYIQRVYR
jgi:hypothetical protein